MVIYKYIDEISIALVLWSSNFIDAKSMKTYSNSRQSSSAWYRLSFLYMEFYFKKFFFDVFQIL